MLQHTQGPPAASILFAQRLTSCLLLILYLIIYTTYVQYNVTPTITRKHSHWIQRRTTERVRGRANNEEYRVVCFVASICLCFSEYFIFTMNLLPNVILGWESNLWIYEGIKDNYIEVRSDCIETVHFITQYEFSCTIRNWNWNKFTNATTPSLHWRSRENNL